MLAHDRRRDTMSSAELMGGSERCRVRCEMRPEEKAVVMSIEKTTHQAIRWRCGPSDAVEAGMYVLTALPSSVCRLRPSVLKPDHHTLTNSRTLQKDEKKYLYFY